MLKRLSLNVFIVLTLGLMSYITNAKKITVEELHKQCWDLVHQNQGLEPKVTLVCKGHTLKKQIGKTHNLKFRDRFSLVGETFLSSRALKAETFQSQGELDELSVGVPFVELLRLSAPVDGVKIQFKSCHEISHEMAEWYCSREIPKYCNDNTADLDLLAKEDIPYDLTGLCRQKKVSSFDLPKLYEDQNKTFAEVEKDGDISFPELVADVERISDGMQATISVDSQSKKEFALYQETGKIDIPYKSGSTLSYSFSLKGNSDEVLTSEKNQVVSIKTEHISLPQVAFGQFSISNIWFFRKADGFLSFAQRREAELELYEKILEDKTQIFNCNCKKAKGIGRIEEDRSYMIHTQGFMPNIDGALDLGVDLYDTLKVGLEYRLKEAIGSGDLPQILTILQNQKEINLEHSFFRSLVSYLHKAKIFDEKIIARLVELKVVLSPIDLELAVENNCSDEYQEFLKKYLPLEQAPVAGEKLPLALRAETEEPQLPTTSTNLPDLLAQILANQKRIMTYLGLDS